MRWDWTGLLLAGTLVVVGGTALGAPTEPDQDRARALRDQAIAAGDKKDWATCEAKASEAWAIAKSPLTAGLLGHCEAALEHYVAAADHLDYALRLDDNPERRASNKAQLEEVKKHVGILLLNVKPTGATVRIGSKPVERQDEEAPIYVSPGHQVIELSRDGYEPGRFEADVAPGQMNSLHFELKPQGAPPSPTKPVWPTALLASVTAVGVGLGIGFMVASVSARDEVSSASCPGGPETCPQSALDALDRNHTFRAVGISALSIGAAAAIGLVVWLPIPAPSGGAKSAAMNVLPVAGPDFGGVVLRGSFQ
ncbi:MAG: hypothetical protein U0414_36020 [Polyangiaceae bacterium]